MPQKRSYLGKNTRCLVSSQNGLNSSAKKYLNSSLLCLEREATSKALTRPSMLFTCPSREKCASFALRKPSTSTRATLLINDDALAIFFGDMDEADNFFPGRKLNTAIRPEISQKIGLEHDEMFFVTVRFWFS